MGGEQVSPQAGRNDEAGEGAFAGVCRASLPIRHTKVTPVIEIPVHQLPADTLFRVFITDGTQTREVLWFKCSDKGDLVTKPCVALSKAFQGYGTTSNGNFVLTTPIQAVELTGHEHTDHPHVTYHPSSKKQSSPVIHGVQRNVHAPTFDTRTLAKLQEVARHQLASPVAYSVRAPQNDEGGKYHAMLMKPYDGVHQPTLTFWLAPIQRHIPLIPDEFLVSDCFIYARCAPTGLQHDLLIQVKLSQSAYTEAGNIHLLCAPTLDKLPN